MKTKTKSSNAELEIEMNDWQDRSELIKKLKEQVELLDRVIANATVKTFDSLVKNKIKTIELIDSLIKAQERQIISQSKLSKKTKENLENQA